MARTFFPTQCLGTMILPEVEHFFTIFSTTSYPWHLISMTPLEEGATFCLGIAIILQYTYIKISIARRNKPEKFTLLYRFFSDRLL